MSEQIQEKIETFEQTDIDSNKIMAGLAYLIFSCRSWFVQTPNTLNFTLTRVCCCSLSQL